MIGKLAVINFRIVFKFIHTGIENLLILFVAEIKFVGRNIINNKTGCFHLVFNILATFRILVSCFNFHITKKQQLPDNLTFDIIRTQGVKSFLLLFGRLRSKKVIEFFSLGRSGARFLGKFLSQQFVEFIQNGFFVHLHAVGTFFYVCQAGQLIGNQRNAFDKIFQHSNAFQGIAACFAE